MDFNETLEILLEREITWVKGSELSPELQKEVKAKHIHRFTGNNKPEWAKGTWKDGKPYPQHFKDDKDWLANTEFAITKKGKLCNKTKYCNSSPTYPNNPELRKKVDESAFPKCCNLNESHKSSIPDNMVTKLKDLLDMIITGEDVSDQQKGVLLKFKLIGKTGQPTQLAKEEFSELFED